MASTTLLFDQRTRPGTTTSCGVSGIDRGLLCDPLPAGTLLGRVHAAAAEATGLKQGTPVVLGGHDYCCGCLPTGAFEPGVLLDVIGTWEMVVSALREPVLTPEVQRMGVLVDSHVARDRYAAMGATVAADMLEWFKREIGAPAGSEAGDAEWARLIGLAAQSPIGSNGVFFLPHMSGSFCPVLDPASCGRVCRAAEHCRDRATCFVRSSRDLNYQFLEIIRAFERGLGVRSDRIVAIGGPTKNRLWMQSKADVTGIVVEVPDVEEAVPLARPFSPESARASIGMSRTPSAMSIGRARLTLPDAQAVARYRELYAQYESLYPALKAFFQK